ncbi:MAG TPA: hypothetical protein VLZ03_15670 [Thermodesulfobacteriota bacterium]|nr:hypothetical protein [Thermodesulfobacteriota bacterium]
MTHSLHRRGDLESLKEDFVVLGCPATGVNKKGSAPNTRTFLSICYKHGPINLGDMKTGNIYNTTMDDILSRVTDGTIVQCTFDNREKIVSLLKDLKENRPGISVIISGVTDVVQRCMDEAGMGRIHSLEYSLGTWGQTEKLPDFQILESVTMCGHAMIAADLVRKMLRDVKRGRRTVEDACFELARGCTCGNYNLTRGKQVFRKLLSTYMVHSLY